MFYMLYFSEIILWFIDNKKSAYYIFKKFLSFSNLTKFFLEKFFNGNNLYSSKNCYKKMVLKESIYFYIIISIFSNNFQILNS